MTNSENFRAKLFLTQRVNNILDFMAEEHGAQQARDIRQVVLRTLQHFPNETPEQGMVDGEAVGKEILQDLGARRARELLPALDQFGRALYDTTRGFWSDPTADYRIIHLIIQLNHVRDSIQAG